MVMTRCQLALGKRDEAERTAALCEQEAARYNLPLSTANAHRATAAVAFEAGDSARAAELALASAAGAEEVGARIEAAHARMLAGAALARVGDKDAATAEFERAASEFEACGATRYREMAEHAMRKLGRAIHRRTQPGKRDGTGPESLTGRETEIARLVVDRRTNPEIASELFLSIKTVETHMRNIFRKLDVSSRVEVARVLERDLHTE
jgi:DNA-binding NarL/FixJ family response regulator